MSLFSVFREAITKHIAEVVVGSSTATWLATVAFTWLSGFNITINLPLLGMSFLALLIASVAWMIKQRKKPRWMKYTDDSFEGVNWRWQYDKKGEVVNVTPRCPVCSEELYLQDCMGKDGVRFLCGNCIEDHYASITALRQEHLNSYVLKRIDGKLYDIRRGAIAVPGFPAS